MPSTLTLHPFNLLPFHFLPSPVALGSWVMGAGNGVSWKLLAQSLHSGGVCMMVTLFLSLGQQDSLAAAPITKQAFLGLALLTPHGEGGRKSTPKHYLSHFSTCQESTLRDSPNFADEILDLMKRNNTHLISSNNSLEMPKKNQIKNWPR